MLESAGRRSHVLSMSRTGTSIAKRPRRRIAPAANRRILSFGSARPQLRDLSLKPAAAHAPTVGAAFVTNNENEFRQVEGLPVENWLGS